MLKNYLLYGVVALLLLGACNKDELDIKASEVINWFAIKDKPGELGHLLHDIYQKSGVSIFVNDTLGYTPAGYDAYGNPVNRYETVSERYLVYTALETRIRFVLCKDTAALLKAARTIDKWVLPNLPPAGENRAKSFLLVDSLLWESYGGDTIRKGGGTAWVFDESMETTPVGKLSEIMKMDERTLKFWAGMVLSARIKPWLNENYADSLALFYKLTNADTPPNAKTLYNLNSFTLHGDLETGEVTGDYSFYRGADLWDYWRMGFLEWVDTEWEEIGRESWMDKDVRMIHRKAPNKNCDVMNYIAAVYAFSDEEFNALFAGVEYSEKCIQKRLYMKRLVELFEVANGLTRRPFA